MVNAEKGICTSVRSTDRCKFNHQVALFSQVIPGTIEKHLHLSPLLRDLQRTHVFAFFVTS